MGLEWVETAGGPFILLPKEYLAIWGGSSLPAGTVDPENPEGSDYDRACYASDCDLIPVGEGFGLVLQGSTKTMASVPVPNASGLFLVRAFASSESDIVEAAHSLPEGVLSRRNGVVEFRSDSCFLLAGGMSGEEVMRAPTGDVYWLPLRIKPGRYILLTSMKVHEAQMSGVDATRTG